ncbi:putative mitochondrial protein [Andalucia godoyi]|uniref:Putative mitochondrial protein n=1 Tax=Andalucia godoyi TaxID=505711 RepID=A0A8K0AHI0_ANDGO|nr:putative mitochondrial protein [Andalucia godoyi]|eukprot:ANDGO_01986.mRNA.1 putative mitochondrial protein
MAAANARSISLDLRNAAAVSPTLRMIHERFPSLVSSTSGNKLATPSSATSGRGISSPAPHTTFSKGWSLSGESMDSFATPRKEGTQALQPGTLESICAELYNSGEIGDGTTGTAGGEVGECYVADEELYCVFENRFTVDALERQSANTMVGSGADSHGFEAESAPVVSVRSIPEFETAVAFDDASFLWNLGFEDQEYWNLEFLTTERISVQGNSPISEAAFEVLVDEVLALDRSTTLHRLVENPSEATAIPEDHNVPIRDALPLYGALATSDMDAVRFHNEMHRISVLHGAVLNFAQLLPRDPMRSIEALLRM